MLSRFEDKIALVTGSTQGLGRAIAHRFAQEGAAGVVVTGRDQERGAQVVTELEATGTAAIFVPAALERPEECQQLVSAASERFGRVDVLVNAAGVTDRGDITDTSVELWDRMFAVNVRAPFLLMQGVIDLMRNAGKGGSIVNIGSVVAHGGVEGLMPYAASKAALVVLTKDVAKSVVWDRIRVNCINPGWMDTPAEDRVQQQYHNRAPDWLTQAEAEQPFGQLIKVEELAALVAFVCSDEAGVMTGSTIDYDQAFVH